MSEQVPSEDEIRKVMEKLIPKVNLETMTTKQFIVVLSKKMGNVKLSSRKKFIKATLTEILDAMEAESEKDNESASSSDEKETKVEVKPKKRAVRKKSPSTSSSGNAKSTGLTAVKEISDDLAAFLGQGKHMARTAVVKGLWDYIKEHDLQNPENRREIFLDDRMKEVFHVDKFTMFTMNKYVGAHIHPFKPVNLNELSENSKKRKREQKEKRAAAKKGVKRKSGTQPPFRISTDLANIVGKAIMPRPQITQALWAYIRKHNLQNPDNKQEILCDELLKKVMGGKSKVNMFKMQKFVGPHLLEKLDKSEYQHEANDDSEVDEDELSDDSGDFS